MWIYGFIVLFLVLIKGMREKGESKISLCYPRGWGAFPQFYLVKGSIIKCVMIKPTVVAFCPIGGRCYSGWWEWDLRTLWQFQGSEIQGCSKTLWMGIQDCFGTPPILIELRVPNRGTPTQGEPSLNPMGSQFSILALWNQNQLGNKILRS